MAFKKAFGQTVRELKREVNKFRLPEIEIKVQEATSNEPWGPHGSLMTEIADATVDPNELQLIMGVLQKRLLDTGKNWRHVYKSMTVMEFLVANGSPQAVESVISFLSQLMPLTEFQYVEQPSGKDQGINVRKKAETMVALLNDRQRINDVRKKAAVNKNKYQGVGSNPAAEKPSGRLEDDDWQKPMQQHEWSQQSSSSTSTQGGSPENFAGSRGPPPSYEEAMRSSIPVDEGFDEFDPRGVPPSSATGFANPSSFKMNPQMSSTNPNASSISNFAPPAAAAFPPLQGSSDKVENAFRAGHMSFKPPSR